MAKLVVCCDGTWNDAADRTDIERIADAARRLRDPAVKVFYDQGVGTDFGFILRGGAVGRGLSRNIRQAYGWLVHNWQPDDQVFMFGFSRGAYTVRSLGGFLHFAGLLRPEDTGPVDRDGENPLVEAAHDAYRMCHRDPKMAADFRATPAYGRRRQPQIRLLGVFDTVGALGVPVHWLQGIINRLPHFNVQFHDTTLGPTVEIACQALAIDERRGPFKPTLWTGDAKPNQTIKQVWFAGVHSDVGGGYPEKALAELPLAWMLNETKAAGLDLWPGFAADLLHADAGGQIHDSMDRGYLILHELSPSIDPYDRPIGPAQRPAGDPVVPGEMVYWSARGRVDGEAAQRLAALRQAPYRPRALVDASGAWRPDSRDWSWLDDR
jgi:uncharacterized protein (DUF2235 family)